MESINVKSLPNFSYMGKMLPIKPDCEFGSEISAGLFLDEPWVTNCYEKLQNSTNETIINEENWIFCNPGIDLRYFTHIIRRLGFTPIIKLYKNASELINGINNNEINMTLNPISTTVTENTTFSLPISTFRVGILVPASFSLDLNTFWLFSPLKSEVWLSSIAITAIIMSIIFIANRRHWKENIWMVVRLLLNQPLTVPYEEIGIRLAYFTLDVMKTLITSCYSAVLIQSLILQETYTLASSFNEVLQLARSGHIKIMMYDNFERKLPTVEAELFSEIAETQLLSTKLHEFEIASEIGKSSDIAYLGDFDSLSIYAFMFQNIRLLPGPYSEMVHYRYLFAENYPCVEQFDEAISHFYDKDLHAELISEYRSWFQMHAYLSSTKYRNSTKERFKVSSTNFDREKRNVQPLSLSHIASILYVLLLGAIMAFIAFLLEKWELIGPNQAVIRKKGATTGLFPSSVEFKKFLDEVTRAKYGTSFDECFYKTRLVEQFRPVGYAPDRNNF